MPKGVYKRTAGHLQKLREMAAQGRAACAAKGTLGRYERTPEHCAAFLASVKALGPRFGSKAPAWKGDGVGYRALHNWIEGQLGKPRKCEECMTEAAKVFNWANISGEYRRDLSDWKRLCRSCHTKFDKGGRAKRLVNQ